MLTSKNVDFFYFTYDLIFHKKYVRMEHYLQIALDSVFVLASEILIICPFFTLYYLKYFAILTNERNNK